MENETENKKLEILVVEDTPIHQEAAKVLLAQHNPQIVGTFDEAVDFIFRGRMGVGASKGKYDAVLTDMFLTQGRGDMMADKSMAKIEMPFGYAIALMACKKGVPNVVVVSDANHHANPIAYTMDFFVGENEKPVIQQVGNSKLAIINSNHLEPTVYITPDRKIGDIKSLQAQGVEIRESCGCLCPPEGSKDVKNWQAALDFVMNGEIYVPSGIEHQKAEGEK